MPYVVVRGGPWCAVEGQNGGLIVEDSVGAVANAIGRLAVVQGPSWLQMSSRAARAVEGVVSSREVLAAMTEAYQLAEEIRMLSERDEVVVLDNLSTGRFENIRPLRENPRFRYFIGSVDFAGSHTSRHMGRVSRT